MFSRYNNVGEEYLEQNIAEDVPKGNEGTETVKYYMLHHAVVGEDKATTKLRVVFDALSHEDGWPSLNDCLLTGPSLNPDLLSFLRFFTHKIAFLADLKQAFLQIPAWEENEQLRILWMTSGVWGDTHLCFMLQST